MEESYEITAEIEEEESSFDESSAVEDESSEAEEESSNTETYVTDDESSENDSNYVDAVTPYDDSSLMAVVNQIADNTSTLDTKLDNINITLMYTLQIGVTMIGVVLAVALGRWIYRITNL